MVSSRIVKLPRRCCPHLAMLGLLIAACDGGIALPFADNNPDFESGPVVIVQRIESWPGPLPLPSGVCEAKVMLSGERPHLQPQSTWRGPWPRGRVPQSPLDSLWASPAFVEQARRPIAIDGPIAIAFVPMAVQIRQGNGPNQQVNDFIQQWDRMKEVADSMGLFVTSRSTMGIRVGLSPYEWVDVVMPWHCFGVVTVWPEGWPLVTFGPIADSAVREVFGQRPRSFLTTPL